MLSRLLAQTYLFGVVFLVWRVSRPLFLWLTPLTLLGMSVVVLGVERRKTPWFWVYVCVVYVGGFILEAVGVATGRVFGAYHYTEVLGYGVANVPLVIGLNWAVLIYAACVAVGGRAAHLPIWAKSLCVGGLLVGLDWLIEPVAIALNFWQWHASQVPLQNYGVWFGYSAAAAAVFFYSPVRRCNNGQASVFLACNVGFFAALRVCAGLGWLG
jgi:putative membrane protein